MWCNGVFFSFKERSWVKWRLFEKWATRLTRISAKKRARPQIDEGRQTKRYSFFLKVREQRAKPWLDNGRSSSSSPNHRLKSSEAAARLFYETRSGRRWSLGRRKGGAEDDTNQPRGARHFLVTQPTGRGRGELLRLDIYRSGRHLVLDTTKRYISPFDCDVSSLGAWRGEVERDIEKFVTNPPADSHSSHSSWRQFHHHHPCIILPEYRRTSQRRCTPPFGTRSLGIMNSVRREWHPWCHVSPE